MRPTVNWVSPPQSVARKASSPTTGSRSGEPASRSSISFGSSRVKALNTRPETAAMRQQHHHGAAHDGRRDDREGLGARPPPWPRRRRARAARAGPTSMQTTPGSTKAQCQPSRAATQRRHHRRQRHAEIAEGAVDADRAADAAGRGGGRLHQHGGADRVVDGGEARPSPPAPGRGSAASPPARPAPWRRRCRGRRPPSSPCRPKRAASQPIGSEPSP